jgi:hypothetical protein
LKKTGEELLAMNGGSAPRRFIAGKFVASTESER